MRFSEKLRFCKRRLLIKWYRLRNVDKTFLATFGLKHVSNDIIAGAYSYIGPDCRICPKVEIGNYTLLANNVNIVGADHVYDKCGIPIVFSNRPTLQPTIIGDDCWIGANAIIMTGVTIGDCTIVGAGAVVTKDLESNGIYVGIPARKIRPRFSDEEYAIHHKTIKNYRGERTLCSKLEKRSHQK